MPNRAGTRICFGYRFSQLKLERSQKKAKKFKKLKHMILALFQSKLGRDRQRKRQKKKFLASFIPTLPKLEHSQKNSIKIQKHHSDLIYSQSRRGQAEKERKFSY